MTSIEVELGLIALAAMLSPTTLTCTVLALILGDRPVRTGIWFYLGALGVTLAIGIVAAPRGSTTLPQNVASHATLEHSLQTDRLSQNNNVLHLSQSPDTNKAESRHLRALRFRSDV
jgi:hypothetical protein